MHEQTYRNPRFPIFGRVYELVPHDGLIVGDNGRTSLTYHDAAEKTLLISSATPDRHRDEVVAIAVAGVAEYWAQQDAGKGR